MNAWTPEQVALARSAECWTTPEWPIRAILSVEILTPIVVDPCCGPGIMCQILEEYGYGARGYDRYDWGYGFRADFMTEPCPMLEGQTCFMNPPFSMACAFVERALELGARKIVCFQRWSWWESAKRRDWWEKYTPQRIYACSDRATCWLVTTPDAERLNAEGRERTTPTAHGWFVFERGQPKGPLIGHISKDMARRNPERAGNPQL